MQHDRSVKSYVEQIRTQAQEFLDFVNSNNQCAYSDRMVENILKTSEKLDKVYNSNFESVEIKQEENLTADERFEKALDEIAERELREYNPSEIVENMIVCWLKTDSSIIRSNDNDWRIQRTNDASSSLSAKIYYKDNEVCDICDNTSLFIITPVAEEWHYVAESAEKAYQSVDKSFICQIVENGELDLTGQDEHRGR